MLLCFKDNRLHIGIANYKDLFKPNIFKNIDTNAIEQEILKEMNLIANFITDLQLDNNLFK